MEISGDFLWFGGAVYSIFIHKNRLKTDDILGGNSVFSLLFPSEKYGSVSEIVLFAWK